VDWSIALILSQDGIINGAIYALLALSLVLVFTATRIILIPAGEFVTYGALTLAFLQDGRVPGTVILLVLLGAAAFARGLWSRRFLLSAGFVLSLAVETIAIPAAIALGVAWLAPHRPGFAANIAMALCVVAPMGPLLYRVVFEPLSEASVLVLLIAALGVHLALTGLGLVFFGAEGWRTPALSDAVLSLGDLVVTGQSLSVLAITAALMLALYLFFGRTLTGKALRATAINRLGARLVGIAPSTSGRIAFLIAASVGALSGILVAPLTSLYYDSGFIIGLKGFVAAIIGGLASYPLAAAAAILVGLVESFSSFWASALKEVIVFLVIIPVLVWRSLGHLAVEEDEG
jgi:branched-chain amino acid transport system permease protein